MKVQGLITDLVTEYTKELIWEDRTATIEDELYIFAKQNHKLFRVNGKVDFIVTDAPIIQKLYYMPEHLDFSKLVIDVYNTYNNLNIFIKRGNFDYESVGRNHTENESNVIEMEMENLLIENNIPYISLESDLSTDDIVTKIIDIAKLKQSTL